MAVVMLAAESVIAGLPMPECCLHSQLISLTLALPMPEWLTLSANPLTVVLSMPEPQVTVLQGGLVAMHAPGPVCRLECVFSVNRSCSSCCAMRASMLFTTCALTCGICFAISHLGC